MRLDPLFINGLAGILLVLVLDLVLGVMVAIKQHTFDLRQLPRTLSDNVLPYVGGLLILGFAASLTGSATFQGVELHPILNDMYLGAAALYAPKLLLDVKDKFAALFGATPPAPPAPNG